MTSLYLSPDSDSWAPNRASPVIAGLSVSVNTHGAGHVGVSWTCLCMTGLSVCELFMSKSRCMSGGWVWVTVGGRG